MTGTVAEAITVAKAELGYSEEGQTNRTKYAAYVGHLNGSAWCATFIAFVLKKAGVPVPALVAVASSRTMYAQAVQAGLGVKPQAVTVGCIAHDWRGLTLSKWKGHVGIVVRVIRDGNGRITHVVTVEGNSNKAGSPTGGSVVMHTWPVSRWRIGYWKPRYTG